MGLSGSSHQRTVSQAQIARPTSEIVYTFSFTTDWFQTENAVAPISAAATATVMRVQRSGNQLTSTRSVIRNHMPAETALARAASMLIRVATLAPIGTIAATRPIRTKNGFPGGCGSPRV